MGDAYDDLAWGDASPPVIGTGNLAVIRDLEAKLAEAHALIREVWDELQDGRLRDANITKDLWDRLERAVTP